MRAGAVRTGAVGGRLLALATWVMLLAPAAGAQAAVASAPAPAPAETAAATAAPSAISSPNSPELTPGASSDDAGGALPLPHWTLATPQQWQRTAKVGEPVDVQLRFVAPPEVTITFPCELNEPPSVKVTPLREGGEEEAQWLTLRPMWGAPVCSGGTLTITGGQRAQYRADLNGLPAGEYRLSGFWFGGKVGDTLGAPGQVLRLE